MSTSTPPPTENFRSCWSCFPPAVPSGECGLSTTPVPLLAAKAARIHAKAVPPPTALPMMCRAAVRERGSASSLAKASIQLGDRLKNTAASAHVKQRILNMSGGTIVTSSTMSMYPPLVVEHCCTASASPAHTNMVYAYEGGCTLVPREQQILAHCPLLSPLSHPAGPVLVLMA